METKATTTRKPKYKPLPAEKDSCILKLHVKEFHPVTRKALHEPFTFKTDIQSYYQFLEFPAGKTIDEVIYLPEGVKTPEQWEKAQAAKRAKKK